MARSYGRKNDSWIFISDVLINSPHGQTEVNGKEEFFDPTAAVGGINTVKVYSVERYY